MLYIIYFTPSLDILVKLDLFFLIFFLRRSFLRPFKWQISADQFYQYFSHQLVPKEVTPLQTTSVPLHCCGGFYFCCYCSFHYYHHPFQFLISFVFLNTLYVFAMLPHMQRQPPLVLHTCPHDGASHQRRRQHET